MKKTLISLLIVAISSFSAFAAPVSGQKAPEFSGKTMTGETISLSDFVGKPVVLEWTNHECPYVGKHYNSGNMQKTQRALTEEGAVWISIASSAPGKHGYITADLAQELTTSRGSYTNHFILDPEGTIGRMYNATSTPHMYIIDEKGTLVYQGAIDDIPSASVRSLPKATNLVLQAWKELKAGEPVSEPHTSSYGCAIKY
ncbi:redoxin domain-containing protein [Kordiimonas aquimaris]|uniref:redoxin domain-containing protein n=1 Tax=Kordiimonas aquimaris TaxID=707591 RepID=UPI0021CDF3AA|nr:redoxin domain-containing protein [Kordiimonas aquimaris]